MQTLVNKPPTEPPTDTPNISHLICVKCNPGEPPWKAFCGQETQYKPFDPNAQKCVVCLEMEPRGCPNGK